MKKKLATILSIANIILLAAVALVFFLGKNSASSHATEALAGIFASPASIALTAFCLLFTAAVATVSVVKKYWLGFVTVASLVLSTFAAAFGISFYEVVLKGIEGSIKPANADLIAGIKTLYAFAAGFAFAAGTKTIIDAAESDKVELIDLDTEVKQETEHVVEAAPVVEEASTLAFVANDLPATDSVPTVHPVRIPFAKKMKASSRDLKDKYDELRDYILSYGLKSRISVDGDTFRLKTVRLVQITVTGNKMKVYFALNPNDYITSTLPVRAATAKKYKDIKAVMDVKSDLSVRRAKILIDTIAEQLGLERTVELY